jgi:hypothetical protein
LLEGGEYRAPPHPAIEEKHMLTDDELKLDAQSMIDKLNGYASTNRVRLEIKQRDGKKRFIAWLIKRDGTEELIMTPWEK